MRRLFVVTGWTRRRWLAAGAILVVLSAIPLSGAAAGDPQTAAAVPPTVRLGAPTGIPEKDTVALERPPLRKPASGRAAGTVRVGQGLRPDGTELATNEVPRPWLIRE